MPVNLFSISGIIYLAGMAAYFFPDKNRRASQAGFFMLTAGSLITAAGFAVRWQYYYQAMDQNIFLSFPVTNLYESIIFCILCTLIIYLMFERKTKYTRTGWLAAFFGGTGMLLPAIMNVSEQASPFVPALKSYWLIAHVLLSFLAYACFAMAAITGTAFLINSKGGKKLQRSMLISNIKSYIKSGTALFTIGGLLFGAVWAQTAWGRFWSWDPKETWAFITWCVYLIFLHIIKRYKLSEKTVAYFSIISFIFVIFTFLGVNLLLSGLHSYGAS